MTGTSIHTCPDKAFQSFTIDVLQLETPSEARSPAVELARYAGQQLQDMNKVLGDCNIQAAVRALDFDCVYNLQRGCQ